MRMSVIFIFAFGCAGDQSAEKNASFSDATENEVCKKSPEAQNR
jgi:hypothetical protein